MEAFKTFLVALATAVLSAIFIFAICWVIPSPLASMIVAWVLGIIAAMIVVLVASTTYKDLTETGREVNK